ncbi:MAG: leucyl/phenylalanyl-tRNA--protein transferase [Nocardioidaceae bacterium]|nr:leucyl/phenylalanyl-tRNA--protein transferase [Nocardioidaceae bacterium]
MPVEPPPTPWVFPTRDELSAIPPDVPRHPASDPDGRPNSDPDGDTDATDRIATGADLEPGTVLAAYRQGLFPMPEPHTVGWWCPAYRGVLTLEELRVSRSLRSSARRFEIRIDSAFDEVIAACADPRRPHGWIDRRIARAYTELHNLGWAHSVEAWREGRLVGGLYGLAIGGLFAGESMFHRETDASKVALMGLVEGLRSDAAGAAGERIVDVQWATPHLRSLGVSTMTRAAYLARLEAVLQVPPAPMWAG